MVDNMINILILKGGPGREPGEIKYELTVGEETQKQLEYDRDYISALQAMIVRDFEHVIHAKDSKEPIPNLDHSEMSVEITKEGPFLGVHAFTSKDMANLLNGLAQTDKDMLLRYFSEKVSQAYSDVMTFANIFRSKDAVSKHLIDHMPEETLEKIVSGE